MRSLKTVKALEDFGRIRLSQSFFMRDFLYSEISQIEGIPNVPENPDLAIKAGTALCEGVLEPIQHKFGRISIRSAYRAPAVNAKGADNKNQYNCSRNESNFARHIWDIPDSDGCIGRWHASLLIRSSLTSNALETGRHWHGGFTTMFRNTRQCISFQSFVLSILAGIRNQKNQSAAMCHPKDI